MPQTLAEYPQLLLARKSELAYVYRRGLRTLRQAVGIRAVVDDAAATTVRRPRNNGLVLAHVLDVRSASDTELVRVAGNIGGLSLELALGDALPIRANQFVVVGSIRLKAGQVR